MKNEIETAIKSLAAVTEKAISPDEAMKYAQSVLNLANALAVIARYSFVFSRIAAEPLRMSAVSACNLAISASGPPSIHSRSLARLPHRVFHLKLRDGPQRLL